MQYKPTLKGLDLDDGFEVYMRINPSRLPSGLLSEKQRGEINGLAWKKAKAYRWFQALEDLAFRNEAKKLLIKNNSN